MPDFVPDDEARDRRLAAIRARRGTPERLAAIDAVKAARKPTRKQSAPSKAGGTGRKTPENSQEFFGHTWPFWFAMRDAGYEHIIERARSQQTTTYAELWASVTDKLGDLGNPWRQIDHLLGYIGEAAHQNDGLMPTALVMYGEAQDLGPGPGFFRMAASMGLLSEADAPPTGEEWRGMTDAQRTFWEEQRDAVFAHFASQVG